MSATLPLTSDRGTAERLQRRASTLVARPLFWLTVVLAGLSVPIVNQLRRPPVPPLPVLGTLADFRLTDQDGRPFGAAELRGKVWLAGFIFTRCPTICPALTARMAKIQRRARGIDQHFRLVSFSVDPAYDTPARLTEFGRRYRASPRLWRFLTGPMDEVKSTVEGGLKIAMGMPQGEQDFASIFHGTHFVLVDRQLRIRGYYDSSGTDVEDRVLHDAAMLINRGD